MRFRSHAFFVGAWSNSTFIIQQFLFPEGEDADGQRVSKKEGSTTTTYIRGADGQTVATYTNGSIDKWNILSGGDVVGTRSSSSPFTEYFVKDHLGSTRAIVNSISNSIAYFDYYPFGKLMPGRHTTSNDDRYKFTSHELDEEAGLDLSYAGARYLDSEIGTWLSIDPMMEFNSPYTYVGNNPLSLIDPTGMISESFLGELVRSAPFGYTTYGFDDDGNIQVTSTGTCPEEPCEEESKDNSSIIGLSSLAATGAGLGLDDIHLKYQSNLYQKGYISGNNGNIQLTGRNLSLFNKNSRFSPHPSTLPNTPFSIPSKILKGTGVGLVAFGTIYDTNSMINGDITVGRWGYRTGSTLTSLGVTSMAGGPAGLVVGSGLMTLEMLYDWGQKVRHEWSVQLGNAEVALRKGIWAPNFTAPN